METKDVGGGYTLRKMYDVVSDDDWIQIDHIKGDQQIRYSVKSKSEYITHNLMFHFFNHLLTTKEIK